VKTAHPILLNKQADLSLSLSLHGFHSSFLLTPLVQALFFCIHVSFLQSKCATRPKSGFWKSNWPKPQQQFELSELAIACSTRYAIATSDAAAATAVSATNAESVSLWNDVAECHECDGKAAPTTAATTT
jgi:hypothetical protein